MYNELRSESRSPLAIFSIIIHHPAYSYSFFPSNLARSRKCVYVCVCEFPAANVKFSSFFNQYLPTANTTKNNLSLSHSLSLSLSLSLSQCARACVSVLSVGIVCVCVCVCCLLALYVCMYTVLSVCVCVCARNRVCVSLFCMNKYVYTIDLCVFTHCILLFNL